MNMKAFTSNFQDKSTEAGFQFVFQCDICKEGYKTSFIESKTFKKKGIFKKIANLLSSALFMSGKRGAYRASWGMRRGAQSIGSGGEGIKQSPKWHQEYEETFELAQNEAKQHFHRCPKCSKWVCENDWNEQEGLCTKDAPRVDVEVAAAKANKTVSDIHAKAAQTQAFTGEIESKQTICSQCSKPAGDGKFCNNCGAELALNKCSKCGAKNPAGIRFCGECGENLS